MTENNETSNTPKIPARAGLMRGVRLWADPDGILESPFDEDGMKLGYVYVYGEDAPAVFDGKNWHSVLVDDQGVDQQIIADQYYKIVDHAEANPAYEELARFITGSAQ
jgi:hypothetical protein